MGFICNILTVHFAVKGAQYLMYRNYVINQTLKKVMQKNFLFYPYLQNLRLIVTTNQQKLPRNLLPNSEITETSKA